MEYFVYLLAAIGATGNAPTTQEASPTSLSRSNPIPKGNPGNWATTNDYPSIALQQELEGTTGFRVAVSPDGRVADCAIVLSSGSSELDSATCANVTRRARFEPARDESGKPTTGYYSNRVRWQIPSSTVVISFPRGPEMGSTAWTRPSQEYYPPKAVAEKRQGRTKVELAISSVGALTDCKILETSTHADLDAESCKLASNRAIFSPAVDIAGQPTTGRIQTEVKWRIPGEGVPLAPGVPIMTPIIPKSLLPKAGTTNVSFTVAADGTLADCSVQTTLVSQSTPDTFCKAKIKFEPYTDANGKAVARRVTTKTVIVVEDVK